MQTRVIFIPVTPELQDDINAILSQPGVEYVDMKIVNSGSCSAEPYKAGGVWLVIRQTDDSKKLV